MTTSSMLGTTLFLGACLTLGSLSGVSSFSPLVRLSSTTRSAASSASIHQAAASDTDKDDAIQWELFQKHHAKGSWKGIWTTYDYIGDVLDEAVASVDYLYEENESVIRQEHTIVVDATRADCATCFDAMQTKTLPVAVYEPGNMRKARFAASGMVNGPTLLRSGTMSTELVLSFGDGRVRVVFQHMPVWERGTEPGSGPPDGLKLVRTLVSREALRDTAPTGETEAAQPPSDGNPVFFRPVPPFDWHNQWGGTSWTWGPNTGDRGWSIEQIEDGDDWHGSSPTELWNLRLPGGLFCQTPRVLTPELPSLVRLAWLADSDNLLRLEAGITCLQPMVLEDNETMVGFEPPSLVSLRCDVLQKMGDLQGEPPFAKERQLLQDERDKNEKTDDEDETPPSSGLDAVRGALRP